MRAFAVLLAALAMTAPSVAQVMTPMELPDPSSQRLQQRYLKALMAIGTEIEAHKFPYPFYFCRILDVDLAKMQAADQRSIRFGSSSRDSTCRTSPSRSGCPPTKATCTCGHGT